MATLLPALTVEKREFLDALEEHDGNISAACQELNIKEKLVDSWRHEDIIFNESVEQIQYEASLPPNARPNRAPDRDLGVRAHELYTAINTRLAQHDPPESVRWSTVKKMCKYLGYLRGMLWNHAEARRLAKISSATLSMWRRRYPEFDDLVDIAERDAILDVYDITMQRALDPTPAGDAMRRLILKGMGHKIGFQGHAPGGNTHATQVNVTVNRTPEESDAILKAHQKAIEIQPMISVNTKKK